MFQVVHPLGLFALGALAVPIVIHLRRRPSPVVRVGNLRPFLAHRRSSRALTLHDWPVFLLRCAILTALALAFAGLRWTPRTPAPTRWCLLLPGTSLHDPHLQDWTLRIQEGFEPHWLAPGFPEITDPTRPPASDIHASVWSLLSEADRQLAAGSEARVFGPTWTSLFKGGRPSLSNLRIHWHAVPTPPPDVPQPPASRVGIVHHPDRVLDAGYLRAALQAIGASIVTNEVPSWIFQLGSVPLPFPSQELEQHGVRIVRDAPETAEPGIVSRRIDVGSQTVNLRQRVVPGPGTPVFRDSHGDPWLTEERQGSVVLWHVAFRLHPDWTDWPLDTAFPAWWQEQIQPGPPNTTEIAPEQASPRFNPDPNREVASTPRRPASTDLRAGCWLLGAALFLAERMRSRRTTHSATPSSSTPE
jgi:hypothetical protein